MLVQHILVQIRLQVLRPCQLHTCSVILNQAENVKPARSRRLGFYDVLGIPQSSRMSDIKAAYLRIAKQHHPDRSQAPESRFIFEEATEAYQCLMDATQRHFYDQHGFPSDELKKRGIPSIFDFKPRYSIYEANQTDNGLEDWFAAQGHSVNDASPGLRQRLKNAYVEIRFGFKFFDFPWRPKAFLKTVVIWVVFCACLYAGFGSTLRYHASLLDPEDDSHPLPLKINEMWNRADNENDILGYLGYRPKISKHDGPLTENEAKKSNHKQDIERVMKSRISWQEQRLQQRIQVLRRRLTVIESEAETIRKTLRELESRPKSED